MRIKGAGELLYCERNPALWERAILLGLLAWVVLVGPVLVFLAARRGRAGPMLLVYAAGALALVGGIFAEEWCAPNSENPFHRFWVLWTLGEFWQFALGPLVLGAAAFFLGRWRRRAMIRRQERAALPPTP